MQYLVENTKEALKRAIHSAIEEDIFKTLEMQFKSFQREKGQGIVRELTGHGLEKNCMKVRKLLIMGNRGEGPLLKSGLTLAIEPMLTLGNAKIGLLPDKWGVITLDGQPSAHFEHTIAIHEGQTEKVILI